MKTKLMITALLLGVALCSRAFSAEPAATAPAPAPAVAPAATPAAAPAAAGPAAPAGKKPYFADWHRMDPVKSLLSELHDIGCALRGDHHCQATAKED
jgi:hypothetical protein